MIPAHLRVPSADIFNSMLEDQLLLVAHGLDGSIDEFIPTLIVFEQYGPSDSPLGPPSIRGTVIVMPDFQPDSGDALLESLGYQAGIEQRLVTMLFLKHEAWMTSYKKSGVQHRGYKWPSQSEQKDEVVIIKAATIDGRRAMAYAQIKRDAKNGMLVGDLVVDAYREEKALNVISRDDYVSAYIRGWHRGFGDILSRLN